MGARYWTFTSEPPYITVTEGMDIAVGPHRLISPVCASAVTLGRLLRTGDTRDGQTVLIRGTSNTNTFTLKAGTEYKTNMPADLTFGYGSFALFAYNAVTGEFDLLSSYTA